jgi:type I restriction enzyme R subunit
VIRLNSKMTTLERKQFEEKVGQPAGKIVEDLLSAFDGDIIRSKAQVTTGVETPSEEQLVQAQKDLLNAAVVPFHDPDVQDLIENVRWNYNQIIDNVKLGTVIFAGYGT